VEANARPEGDVTYGRSGPDYLLGNAGADALLGNAGIRQDPRSQRPGLDVRPRRSGLLPLAKDGEADYVDGGEDTDDGEFDPGLDTFVSIP
jgi:hypothetical protein